jgi:hypothetical protein
MPLPGFSDPNAQAAANAGRGLSNLGNFLYEQQVQKPAIQAQTAATTAGAAQTTAQTQALQQQTGMQGLELPTLQQQAIIATHPGVSKNTLESTQPQSTDVSTQGYAPQSSTTPDVTAGAMGSGSSGGSPGSMSSPVLPNTQPPSQAGSSTQGASSESGISAPQPGTLVQPKLKPTLGAFDSDELSPVALTKPSAPVATGSNSGATSTPPPTGMSTISPLTPPVSPDASITAPEKPFDLRQHLGDDIGSYPQWKRDQILADLRKPFIDKGVPVPSDAYLTGYYRDQQAAYYPTMAQRIGSGGMVPIKATLGGPGGGSAEYVNPNAAGEISANGGNEVNGSAGSNQMYLGPDGTWHENKNFTPADKVQATQSTIAESNNALKLGNEAMQAIEDNPRLVGPVGGQQVGHLARQAEAVAGSPQNLTGESKLNQFQSKEFLETLGTLHVGRVTDKEYQAVMATMPRRDEPAQAWKDWNKSHFQPLMKTINDSLQQELKTQQGGTQQGGTQQGGTQQGGTQQALPNVDVSAPVGAPGQAAPQSNGGLQTFTVEQMKALPKGYGSFMGTNGRVYTK